MRFGCRVSVMFVENLLAVSVCFSPVAKSGVSLLYHACGYGFIFTYIMYNGRHDFERFEDRHKLR